jgi:hypothetical protein
MVNSFLNSCPPYLYSLHHPYLILMVLFHLVALFLLCKRSLFLDYWANFNFLLSKGWNA